MIQPVVFTWASKVLSRDGDDAARAITLYAMNGMYSSILAADATHANKARVRCFIRLVRFLGHCLVPSNRCWNS